jgi:predicted PurR-regulated permease PerM
MSENNSENSQQKVSAYFLLALLVGTGVVLFEMVKIFLVPVVLAATFAGLFYPLYRKLLIWTRGREGLSSLTCCLVLLLVLLGPAYIVADLVLQESLQLYKSAGKWTSTFMNGNGGTALYQQLNQYEFLRALDLNSLSWQQPLQEGLKTVAGWITSLINKTSRGTLQLVANLFITLFTLFYFFRDGEMLIRRLRELSPLDAHYEHGLIERFTSVSRATIKGTLFIGLVQGSLGGLTLWAFGFGSPALWGVVMVVLSVIPLVGTWMVLYPAGLFEILSGNLWTGIAIMLITGLIISSVDNILRPYLIGRDTGMHDLLVFFSTLGGLSVFGVMGFIIGPVLASLFVALLEFYSLGYRQQKAARAET